MKTTAVSRFSTAVDDCFQTKERGQKRNGPSTYSLDARTEGGK